MLFRATRFKTASHHIPTGRRKLYRQQVPAEILAMMEERDDLRKQDTASPRLSTMNDEITKATSDHKRRQWREFVESIDHRTDSTKLWRTIKGIDGKSKQTADNEGITFTGRSHTSPKLIANSFNRQFTTSKLDKHSSLRRTRHVSKDVKRMSLEQAESFTSDQVTSAIKSCRSSRAYGPDTLSLFHLKNLGPLATEHLTALYNDSLLPPSVDLEDLISHPDSQARQGLITRHLIQTHLAAMPSCQGSRGADLTLYQRISLTS